MSKIIDFKNSIELCERIISNSILNINNIIFSNDDFITFMEEENYVGVSIYNVFEIFSKLMICSEEYSKYNLEDYEYITEYVSYIYEMLKKRFALMIKYDDVFGYKKISGFDETYILVFRKKPNKFDNVTGANVSILYKETDDFPFKENIYVETVFDRTKLKMNKLLKIPSSQDSGYDNYKEAYLKRMKK